MLYSMCMAFIYEKLLYMCMPYNWVIFGEEVWDSTSPSIPQKHWWTLLYPKPWSNPIKASHMQLAYSKSFFPGRHLQPNQYFCWMTLLQHLRLTDRRMYQTSLSLSKLAKALYKNTNNPKLASCMAPLQAQSSLLTHLLFLSPLSFIPTRHRSHPYSCANAPWNG